MDIRAVLTTLDMTWEELAMIRAQYIREQPDGIVLLIGSNAWIAREKRRAEENERAFVASKSLKREYARLPQIEVTRVNSGMDSVTGKELDANLVNYLELVLALNLLPEGARECFLLHACDGMTYEEIAEERGMTENAVMCAVSRASSDLIARVFEPVYVRINVG